MRVVLYSLLPLLVLVVFAEGTARVYERGHPATTGKIDLSFGFNPELRVFPPDPGGDPTRLSRFRHEIGSPDVRTFSIRKPDGVFRIFMLGGSSVAFLQKHFEALETRLNERYANEPRIELINAGMYSYGSQRVMIVAQEVIEYGPDLLVLYTGHNEFEDLAQLHLAEKSISSFQRLLNHVALYRIYWHRGRERQLEILQSTRNMELLKAQPFSDYDDWKRTFSPSDVPERMRDFQRNVEAIVALCEHHDVPLIIGTAPSNYWEPSFDSGQNYYYMEIKALLDEGRYEAYNDAMDEWLSQNLRRQSSAAENAAIRSVAEAYDLPLADVEAAIRQAEPHGVPGETLFNDPCHLNDAGNDVWIETFTPLITAEIDRRQSNGD